MEQKLVESGTDGGAALMPHPDVAPSTGGVAAGVLMCVMSMSSIQFGSALSSPIIHAYGPAGATWLRLVFASIALAIIVRPKIMSYSRSQWLGVLALGTVSALMTTSFFSAIARIPLGLAVAIEFLGPLLVATTASGSAASFSGRSLRQSAFCCWPMMAKSGSAIFPASSLPSVPERDGPATFF
jgi:inner membrane transporter RhtA